MRLEILHERYFKALHEVALRAESWAQAKHACNFYEFQQQMKQRSGFVIVSPDGKLAGCISFSDYVAGANIIIHAFVEPKYHRRWVSRKNLGIIANYVYDELYLPRMTGFSIAEKSDTAGDFLLALGFKHEGTLRKAAKVGNELHDLKLYGLLKEECKWLVGAAHPTLQQRQEARGKGQGAEETEGEKVCP